ncbi:Phage integrase [Acetobacter pomorum]|nr:Phage integrase [Acetobacter pomorum]
MHGLKLTGGNAYSARLSIPKDRWQDVGRVYSTKSGIKQEIIRSLQTRDPKEAIKRRDKALAEMRAEVDRRLKLRLALNPCMAIDAPNGPLRTNLCLMCQKPQKQGSTRIELAEVTSRQSTINAIHSALEAVGVEFIAENGGGAGVRLRKDSA